MFAFGFGLITGGPGNAVKGAIWFQKVFASCSDIKIKRRTVFVRSVFVNVSKSTDEFRNFFLKNFANFYQVF